MQFFNKSYVSLLRILVNIKNNIKEDYKYTAHVDYNKKKEKKNFRNEYNSLNSPIYISRIIYIIVIWYFILLNIYIPNNNEYYGKAYNYKDKRYLSEAETLSTSRSNINTPLTSDFMSLLYKTSPCILDEVFENKEEYMLKYIQEILGSLNKYMTWNNYGLILHMDDYTPVTYNNKDIQLDKKVETIWKKGQKRIQDIKDNWDEVMLNERSKYNNTVKELKSYYDKLRLRRSILVRDYDSIWNDYSKFFFIIEKNMKTELYKLFNVWYYKKELYMDEYRKLVNSCRIAWKALSNHLKYTLKMTMIYDIEKMNHIRDADFKNAIMYLYLRKDDDDDDEYEYTNKQGNGKKRKKKKKKNEEGFFHNFGCFFSEPNKNKKDEVSISPYRDFNLSAVNYLECCRTARHIDKENEAHSRKFNEDTMTELGDPIDTRTSQRLKELREFEEMKKRDKNNSKCGSDDGSFEENNESEKSSVNSNLFTYTEKVHTTNSSIHYSLDIEAEEVLLKNKNKEHSMNYLLKDNNYNGSIGNNVLPVNTIYYEILNVDTNAKLNEIKSNYYYLSLQYHPDYNIGDRIAKLKFRLVSEAYQVLSDDERRRIYNKHGLKATENMFLMEPGLLFMIMYSLDEMSHYIGDLKLFYFIKEAFEKKKRIEDIESPFEDMDIKMEYEQRKREVVLALLLRDRIQPFVDNNKEWVSEMEKEIKSLLESSHSNSILGSIGWTYENVATKYLSEVKSKWRLKEPMSKYNPSFRHVNRSKRTKMTKLPSRVCGMYSCSSALISQQPSMDETSSSDKDSNVGSESIYNIDNMMSEETLSLLEIDENKYFGFMTMHILTLILWDIEETTQYTATRVLRDEGVDENIRIKRAEALQILGKLMQKWSLSVKNKKEISEKDIIEIMNKERAYNI
ncbi:RESA-like protein with PHIST and DnaJ domains [Plasmodium gaboni]|uniref:RESA-like protein with PHIST and DnaJ domains n=1 Tax=Plasmodium gaboni TaxID=647221 RepID=A0ABY1UQS5_9APIC|nr:RESA-like protein with PHIST and DnaJ domains [Plasmodium gaboni]